MRHSDRGVDADRRVTVRRYRRDDREGCRALWRELTEWHRALYDRPHIGGERPELAFDEHLESVGAENVWIADAGGEVVGMAALVPHGAKAEIEPVSVRSTHRRLGIGRQLVDAIVATARERGLEQIVVRPVARNAPALAFFHARGFDVLGRVELLLDLEPRTDGPWRAGERLGGRDFRV